jgi:hypothetical protein
MSLPAPTANVIPDDTPIRLADAVRNAPSGFSGSSGEGVLMETQVTINEWITQTFGVAGSNLSCAARANEEMAELLMKLAVNDFDESAVEECADVVIILYRIAHRFGMDLHKEIDRKMATNRARQGRSV